MRRQRHVCLVSPAHSSQSVLSSYFGNESCFGPSASPRDAACKYVRLLAGRERWARSACVVGEGFILLCAFFSLLFPFSSSRTSRRCSPVFCFSPSSLPLTPLICFPAVPFLFSLAFPISPRSPSLCFLFSVLSTSPLSFVSLPPQCFPLCFSSSSLLPRFSFRLRFSPSLPLYPYPCLRRYLFPSLSPFSLLSSRFAPHFRFLLLLSPLPPRNLLPSVPLSTPRFSSHLEVSPLFPFTLILAFPATSHPLPLCSAFSFLPACPPPRILFPSAFPSFLSFPLPLCSPSPSRFPLLPLFSFPASPLFPLLLSLVPLLPSVPSLSFPSSPLLSECLPLPTPPHGPPREHRKPEPHPGVAPKHGIAGLIPLVLIATANSCSPRRAYLAINRTSLLHYRRNILRPAHPGALCRRLSVAICPRRRIVAISCLAAEWLRPETLPGAQEPAGAEAKERDLHLDRRWDGGR
ncbi:hypothetical protein C7M84_017874, partial [Penaeus vannamei]